MLNVSLNFPSTDVSDQLILIWGILTLSSSRCYWSHWLFLAPALTSLTSAYEDETSGRGPHLIFISSGGRRLLTRRAWSSEEDKSWRSLVLLQPDGLTAKVRLLHTCRHSSWGTRSAHVHVCICVCACMCVSDAEVLRGFLRVADLLRSSVREHRTGDSGKKFYMLQLPVSLFVYLIVYLLRLTC